MRRRDDSVYDPDEESVNVHSLAKNDAGHAHWEHVTESEFYRMGIGRWDTHCLTVLMMKLMYVLVKEWERMKEPMWPAKSYIFYQKTERELPY